MCCLLIACLVCSLLRGGVCFLMFVYVFADCCLLLVDRCLLFVVCYVFVDVVRCLLSVVCWLLVAVRCCMLLLFRCLLFVVRCFCVGSLLFVSAFVVVCCLLIVMCC